MSHEKKNNAIPESILWLSQSDSSSKQEADYNSLIHQQIKKTQIDSENYIQELGSGIFSLTLAKPSKLSALSLKKLCDKAQYSLLPNAYNQETFIKISLSQLKNICHTQEHCYWLENFNQYHQVNYHPQIFFFYLIKEIEQDFISHIEPEHFTSKEKLSNRIIIVSNNTFNHPFNLSIIPSYSLWNNETTSKVIESETNKLKQYFKISEALIQALKTQSPEKKWQLSEGILYYEDQGISRSFDYASLSQDIMAAEQGDNITEYVRSFCVKALDSSLAFPTVSIRSNLHSKARPQTMCQKEQGYSICASQEKSGKQTSVDWPKHKNKSSFKWWLNRSFRHLPRHQYHARAIFYRDGYPNVLALVGEQVASIALFPKLIKGVLEQLNISHDGQVRLLAHYEDILVIATVDTPWSIINEVNQKAEALFKMVALDGADPLSLFEQKLLPPHGCGNFNLSVVPSEFFELLETARTMKQSMPPGHDHYLLGLAFECLHEWGLAIEQFQKALRKDSQDPDILSALGSALLEVGEAKAALPFIKQASELIPQDAEIANNLGRINLECGQISDAIQAFEKAVQLSPGSANFLANLGNGYFLAKRNQDALVMLTKAIKCDPTFAQAHESLAHLHLQSGDQELAKKHALMAYKENPVDANIANLLWQLTLGQRKTSVGK